VGGGASRSSRRQQIRGEKKEKASKVVAQGEEIRRNQTKPGSFVAGEHKKEQLTTWTGMTKVRSCAGRPGKQEKGGKRTGCN